MFDDFHFPILHEIAILNSS